MGKWTFHSLGTISVLLAYKINYPDSFFFSEKIMKLIEFINFMMNIKDIILNHEKLLVTVY